MLPSSIFKPAACLLATLLIATPSQAHRVWIKPSETVLSGKENYVTVDAAVSNTLFVPEHVPLNPKGLEAKAPNGQTLTLENISQGKYRTTFDVALTQQGTYKIATASAGIRAFWKDSDGKRHMWPSRRGPGAGETFENSVPKEAQDLKVTFGSRRTETFVTLGTPSGQALKPTLVGLELVPVTHPNDLFATEPAQFQFLMDGQPVAGVEIEIVRGSMRYRNAAESILVKSGDKGLFSVTWPEAGMYFLEASYQDGNAKAPATVRQGAYSVTLEVLPL